MRTTLLGGIAIVVLAGGCAAMHRQTVENMKRNGDPRAPCYEACGPSDLACFKECDNKHPFAGTILQGAASGGGGGGGGGGGEAAPAGTAEASPAPQPQPPSGITAAQVEMLTAAALQDAARKRAATSSPSSTSPSTSTSTSTSTSSSSSSSSFTSSQSKSRAPSSNTDCNPACSSGQKCVVYLQGTKQCAAGGRCWTVDRTHAECK